MSQPLKILVVEDDDATRMLLERLLSFHDHVVQTAADAAEAIRVSDTFSPQVLVTDWLLRSSGDGLSVAQALRQKYPDLHVVFLTGMPIENLIAALRGFERYRTIEKSTSIDLLLEAVQLPDSDTKPLP